MKNDIEKIMEELAKCSDRIIVVITSYSIHYTKLYDDTLAFVSGEVGNHEIVLKASNAGGEYATTFSVSVFGKYRDGVWVLNSYNFV